MSNPRSNKEVLRTHFEVAINEQRPELYDEIMAEGYDLHHPMAQPGRAAYVEGLLNYWKAFPDMRVEVQRLVCEGELVAAHYVETATHKGEFFGIAPTGRTYRKNGIGIYRVADGRMQEAWIQEDDRGYVRDLGLESVWP